LEKKGIGLSGVIQGALAENQSLSKNEPLLQPINARHQEQVNEKREE
jgi:hypothetical protein